MRWVSWRLNSSATVLFAQQLVHVNIKGNIKAPHYWPFVTGEFPSHIIIFAVAKPTAWTLNHWNLAMFSDGATGSEITDKDEFPNIVRVNSPFSKMGPACLQIMKVCTMIARFMGPTWGPSGTDRTQVGPMLAPWTLLSGLSRSLKPYRNGRYNAEDFAKCIFIN